MKLLLGLFLVAAGLASVSGSFAVSDIVQGDVTRGDCYTVERFMTASMTPEECAAASLRYTYYNGGTNADGMDTHFPKEEYFDVEVQVENDCLDERPATCGITVNTAQGIFTCDECSYDDGKVTMVDCSNVQRIFPTGSQTVALYFDGGDVPYEEEFFKLAFDEDRCLHPALTNSGAPSLVPSLVPVSEAPTAVTMTSSGMTSDLVEGDPSLGHCYSVEREAYSTDYSNGCIKTGLIYTYRMAAFGVTPNAMYGEARVEAWHECNDADENPDSCSVSVDGMEGSCACYYDGGLVTMTGCTMFDGFFEAGTHTVKWFYDGAPDAPYNKLFFPLVFDQDRCDAMMISETSPTTAPSGPGPTSGITMTSSGMTTDRVEGDPTLGDCYSVEREAYSTYYSNGCVKMGLSYTYYRGGVGIEWTSPEITYGVVNVEAWYGCSNEESPESCIVSVEGIAATCDCEYHGVSEEVTLSGCNVDSFFEPGSHTVQFFYDGSPQSSYGTLFIPMMFDQDKCDELMVSEAPSLISSISSSPSTVPSGPAPSGPGPTYVPFSGSPSGSAPSGPGPTYVPFSGSPSGPAPSGPGPTYVPFSGSPSGSAPSGPGPTYVPFSGSPSGSAPSGPGPTLVPVSEAPSLMPSPKETLDLSYDVEVEVENACPSGSVSATVVDFVGDPVVGADVGFLLNGARSYNGNVMTDENGKATFEFDAASEDSGEDLWCSIAVENPNLPGLMNPQQIPCSISVCNEGTLSSLVPSTVPSGPAPSGPGPTLVPVSDSPSLGETSLSPSLGETSLSPSGPAPSGPGPTLVPVSEALSLLPSPKETLDLSYDVEVEVENACLTGSISITVTDFVGDPVVGADVGFLLNGAHSYEGDAVTDEDGKANFEFNAASEDSGEDLWCSIAVENPNLENDQQIPCSISVCNEGTLSSLVPSAVPSGPAPSGPGPTYVPFSDSPSASAPSGPGPTLVPVSEAPSLVGTGLEVCEIPRNVRASALGLPASPDPNAYKRLFHGNPEFGDCYSVETNLDRTVVRGVEDPDHYCCATRSIKYIYYNGGIDIHGTDSGVPKTTYHELTVSVIEDCGERGIPPSCTITVESAGECSSCKYNETTGDVTMEDCSNLGKIFPHMSQEIPFLTFNSRHTGPPPFFMLAYDADRCEHPALLGPSPSPSSSVASSSPSSSVTSVAPESEAPSSEYPGACDAPDDFGISAVGIPASPSVSFQDVLEGDPLDGECYKVRREVNGLVQRSEADPDIYCCNTFEREYVYYNGGYDAHGNDSGLPEVVYLTVEVSVVRDCGDRGIADVCTIKVNGVVRCDCVYDEDNRAVSIFNSPRTGAARPCLGQGRGIFDADDEEHDMIKVTTNLNDDLTYFKPALDPDWCDHPSYSISSSPSTVPSGPAPSGPGPTYVPFSEAPSLGGTSLSPSLGETSMSPSISAVDRTGDLDTKVTVPVSVTFDYFFKPGKGAKEPDSASISVLVDQTIEYFESVFMSDPVVSDILVGVKAVDIEHDYEQGHGSDSRNKFTLAMETDVVLEAGKVMLSSRTIASYMAGPSDQLTKYLHQYVKKNPTGPRTTFFDVEMVRFTAHGSENTTS